MKLVILSGSLLLAALLGTSIGRPVGNAAASAPGRVQTVSARVEAVTDAPVVQTLSEVIVVGKPPVRVRAKVWTCSSEWKPSMVGGSYRDCGWK